MTKHRTVTTTMTWMAGLALILGGVAPAVVRAQDDRSLRHRVPAEFMSYRGADWLERAGRADEEQPERVLDAMALAPGDRVADVGCGSGYYARRIARRVAPGGVVYCEDIQPEMLDLMRQRAEAERITNIESVLGSPTDPRLPDGTLDWIIMADVYHEMSDPEPMLAGLRRALAPTGRVALLEYRVEDGTGDHIKADHAMSVRQVLGEWQAAGFELVALHDFLPSQHLFFFRVAGRGEASDLLADHDLFDALAGGIVEVEARGDGDGQVSVRIRRTGASPVVVTTPAATVFAAADDGVTDQVARRDGWITLRDDDWRDWSIRTVGRQRDRRRPSGDDPLTVHPPSTVPRLASVLSAVQAGTYTVANSPTLYPPRTPVVEQAAVWIADGDHGFDEMAPDLAGPRVPPVYAAAFALVFLDRGGVDVTTRRVWDDRADVFRGLRDQGLNLWYRLKTAGE